MAGLVIIGLVMLSPLGTDILTRANHGYSNDHRTLLYGASVSLAPHSPILGYGAPVSVSVAIPGAPPGPSVGTQGTLWTILVANGIPALVFFLLWLLYGLLKTARRIPSAGGRESEAHFWCHVSILAALVQLPFYELLPWGMPILMVAMAVALREQTTVIRTAGPPGSPARTRGAPIRRSSYRSRALP